MELKPLNDPPLIEQIADWLSQKENYQWVDYGNGRQILSGASLRMMAQRDIHLLRAFTPDGSDEVIGVAGLSNIDRTFKTALVSLCVLGDKRYAGQGYGTRAMSRVIGLGFNDLGLESMNAWVVENNTASIRMLERINFRLIGRQRRCHYIDGRPYDRLLFDLLACEHKEL
jgi:RimJ/RimL family protein N-acetyltransferase